jgi:hypothetical protein
MLKECLAINGHRNRNRTMYRLNRIAVILLGFAILIQVEIAQSLAADGPTYDTVEVVGKDSPFVETLELRGATVHGYETTDVMSKLAGYVSASMATAGRRILARWLKRIRFSSSYSFLK